jgi:hypothetical protein
LPTSSYTAVELGGPHGLALRNDGTLAAWGSNWQGECNVPPLPTGLAWQQFSAGGSSGGSGHSVALRSNGTAVAWGDDRSGATTLPPLPAGTTWVHADAGVRHTLLVRSDGALFAIGDNGDGQCNVPPLPPRTRYVRAAAGYQQSAALRSDGRIVAWGNPANGLTNVPAPPPGVHFVDVDCALAGDTIAGRTSDGGVITWGVSAPWQPVVVPPPEPGIAYVELDVGLGTATVRAATRSSFTRFANGCAGSLPAATLVPSDTPRIGTSLQVTVRELPVDAAFLVVGFGTTTSNFGPLPLALAPFGMPGCTARVGDDAVHFLGGSDGEARWTLGIPHDAGLVGVTFHLQAVVLDPIANPAGAVLSDAMRALVGGR